MTERKARIGGGNDSNRKASAEGVNLPSLVNPLGPQRVLSLCGSEAPHPKLQTGSTQVKRCGSHRQESGGKEVPIRNLGPGVLHISGCCPSPRLALTLLRWGCVLHGKKKTEPGEKETCFPYFSFNFTNVRRHLQALGCQVRATRKGGAPALRLPHRKRAGKKHPTDGGGGDNPCPSLNCYRSLVFIRL